MITVKAVSTHADLRETVKGGTKLIDLNGTKTITDAELLAKDIPPVNFIIPGLLPATGLAVVGGAPKMGKSLMMTDLGLAISGGSRFLNVFDVWVGEVLYLCLEDTEQGMQARIKIMQPGCPGSGLIHLAFAWGDDPILRLSRWLDAKPNTKIVIIDTIGKLSPSFTQGDYTKQYQKLGELKMMANARNIMIVIVHHLRKSKSNDPFEMLYGSNAISGAADVIWILQRERGEDYANLIVSGRDVPDQKLCMKLDHSLLSWVVIDQFTADLLRQELRKVYQILNDKGIAMTLAEISLASGFKSGALSKYLIKLIEYGYIERVGYGKYRSKHGRREEKAGLREVSTNNQSGLRESTASGTTPCDEYRTVAPSQISLAA